MHQGGTSEAGAVGLRPFNCDCARMTPSALRKPAMTAEEMRAENLESLKMPKRPSRTAAIMMVTGMYAMPCALARAAMGTATTEIYTILFVGSVRCV